jgi:hypothetical protein
VFTVAGFTVISFFVVTEVIEYLEGNESAVKQGVFLVMFYFVVAVVFTIAVHRKIL